MAQDSADNLARQASRTVVERLTWHTVSHDQAGIAREMAEGQDISEICGLGDATLFDRFLCVLEQIGVTPLCCPPWSPTETQRASDVAFPPALLVCLLRVTAGLRYFWHIEPVLLHSVTLDAPARLRGFN